MTTVSESLRTYSTDAKVPVFKDGRPNPRAYKQLSAGSILGALLRPLSDGGNLMMRHGELTVWCTIGLLGGVAVSSFSKTLALLFGMLVFGVQV